MVRGRSKNPFFTVRVSFIILIALLLLLLPVFFWLVGFDVKDFVERMLNEVLGALFTLFVLGVGYLFWKKTRGGGRR